MKWDFRHHLLLQIEMLRGGISCEEFSERLGEMTERRLARYVAGKTHLQDSEFRLIAKALSIDAQTLAQAWASSLGLRVFNTDAVSQMVQRAYCRWRQHSRISGVPSSPSPMAIIRARYADRLPMKTPPLRFGAHFRSRSRKDARENRARFARAYEMLVDSVHGGLASREIGAMRGISGERARQLMVCAAYIWASSERIDLSDRSVPFKNEAKFVKNLYAGLRFFAQQRFYDLAAEALAKGPVVDGDQIP
ncbi:hypothetical protein [Granulicella sp. dw_53]|uniref:hypothetical protein n=1 Tax=Granulicella sp. dw_53 TaxID=2719792 RepID=UPI001BD3E718|nr:hypothetical protein [Granulicella sp. dw_53]